MSSPRPVLLALLGVLAMSLLPAVAADTEAALTRPVTDFTASTPDLGWYVVNDGVMGGRSQGDFALKGEAIDFAGRTNTNGGGFSSIRTRSLKLDLGGFDGIRVRVRGDGRRYTWRLTTDARWRGRQVGYWADFQTQKGVWTVADIPFSSFKPQWRGRKLPGLELDPSSIRGMGLMIYDKQDGPFALRLDSVHGYRAQAPFSLRDERWKSRVLVAYAPTPDDSHLESLLAEVAATRAEFEDRDMLLVVLHDAAGSRAGDRPLNENEARAAQRAAGIEPGSFALRLHGKDGEIKRSAAAHTEMKELYALIDSMPMRRVEMRMDDAERKRDAAGREGDPK